ncbi:MAG: putative ABC transporter permease [Candidatus Nomurabacteria bacterium]|nr:putative ABC transporter permease [Candidatus Nomurabacteria bacterium]
MPNLTRKLTFWRDLALYFMVFSFVGHWVEMLVAVAARVFLGEELGYGIMSNVAQPYTIYGLGVAACILVTRFLAVKPHRNLLLLYLACATVCAVVEYVSALIIVFRYGHNPFWDYSDMPLNLNGYICLRNTLVFGAIATLFMWFIYPQLNRLVRGLGEWRINYIFVLVLMVFVIGLVAY